MPASRIRNPIALFRGLLATVAITPVKTLVVTFSSATYATASTAVRLSLTGGPNGVVGGPPLRSAVTAGVSSTKVRVASSML